MVPKTGKKRLPRSAAIVSVALLFAQSTGSAEDGRGPSAQAVAKEAKRTAVISFAAVKPAMRALCLAFVRDGREELIAQTLPIKDDVVGCEGCKVFYKTFVSACPVKKKSKSKSATSAKPDGATPGEGTPSDATPSDATPVEEPVKDEPAAEVPAAESEGSAEGEAGVPTPTPVPVKQRIPHPEVTAAASLIAQLLAKDERQHEYILSIIVDLRKRWRGPQPSLTPGARDYLDNILSYLESPFEDELLHPKRIPSAEGEEGEEELEDPAVMFE